MSKINRVEAMTIFDSRSSPTVEVEVELENGVIERASVATGVSEGTREAKVLRDDDSNRFFGKGVDRAVTNVNEVIFPEIVGMDVTEQQAIDAKMIALDGTENKGRLGANAILGVSLAVAKTAASDLGIPLYKYIGQLSGEPNPNILPIPIFNAITGGLAAKNNLDFQSFMLVPLRAESFFEALRMGVETFHNLKEVFKKREYDFSISDEGGYSPIFHEKKQTERIEEAIRLTIEGMEAGGYKPYEDMGIALDPVANNFYQKEKYILGGEVKSPEDMIYFYSYLVNNYPIVSIEDGMAEKDLEGWTLLTKRLGEKIQLVGDDLFVTNLKFFEDGLRRGLANAINIMLNQIGTLSETLKIIKTAKESEYSVIISHRSGETEDTTIADIAVGCSAGQIKAGGLSRTDRVAKYNQLIRIEEDLGNDGLFSCLNMFSHYHGEI